MKQNGEKIPNNQFPSLNIEHDEARGISKYKDSSASVQEVSHGRVGRHFSKSKQNYITIIEESCNYNINKHVV